MPAVGASDNVSVYYRAFPLEQIHPWARRASALAACAMLQSPDAFVMLTDLLFNEQPVAAELTNNRITELFAAVPDFSRSALEACVAAGTGDEVVARDIESGKRLGIMAVPTIFINGRRFEGALTADALKSAIDEARTRAK